MAKNEISLGDNQPLSNDLKPIKVGGEASIINVSSPTPDGSIEGKVTINGDLTVTGKTNGKDISDHGDITQVSFGAGSDTKSFTSGDTLLMINGGSGINSVYTTASDTIAISAVDANTSTKGVVQTIDEDDMATDSTTRVPTQQSVKAYVDNEVAGLVDSAPSALNTLNELASALNDDSSFSTTITNSIATKLPLTGGTLTGALTIHSSTDALLNFKTSDDSWAYMQFLENDGTRRAYIGMDADLDRLIINATENGANEIEMNTTTVDMNAELNISGNIVTAGLVDGVDIATRDGVLTSTTTTANAALPLAGGDMTGHLQITATDGSHSGNGAYVPSGTDWQNVLRLGSTGDNGINFLVNDGGTNKVSYYTNRWGSQHEWARGSEDTGDGNTYQPMMRLTSNDSNTNLLLYDGTSSSANVRITSESSNDTYFNNSDNGVAIGSPSAGGHKLQVTGTTHITGALTVDSTVDGRDLQTDGTKLDGIEASADVTDTANVTSAGALMDSELTDLAGVKGVTISTLQVKPSEGAFANGDKTKLDGIEASATADQTKSDINGLAITTVGTIDDGTWEGTAVEADYVGQLPTSKITAGTFADARISASSVTQHTPSIHWTRSTGGYFTANNTSKYTQSWEGDETWGNTVSITTALGGAMSVNYSDVYGGIWIAPVASKVTKSSIVVRAVSYADDITIKLWKINPSDLRIYAINSVDITMPNTSSIVTSNTDLSSGNEIEENYVLLATMEKQATTGSSRIYFTWTISGTYD